MTQIPKDSPLMRAWENYASSEAYQNSFHWAAHEEHRQGSMWAAFMAGFLAGNPGGAKSDSENEKSEAPPVASTCARFSHGQPVKIPLGDSSYQHCLFVGMDMHGISTVKTQGGRYKQVWDSNLYEHNADVLAPAGEKTPTKPQDV